MHGWKVMLILPVSLDLITTQSSCLIKSIDVKKVISHLQPVDLAYIWWNTIINKVSYGIEFIKYPFMFCCFKF